MERLDTELVLKSNDGSVIEIPVENGSLGASITEIVVVYKPTKGFCEQNRFFPLQWVQVDFEDQTVKGQIVRADTIIEVKLKDFSLYIPVERGLPSGVKIARISKPLAYEAPEQIEVEVEVSPEENEILGYLEEDESEMVQYFYSIEQQTSDLLEHLLMFIEEKDRTPIIMKKMFKTIQRYKELRSKYTVFTNGIFIKKLPRDQIFSNTLEMKNKCFIPVSRDIEINYYDEQDANATFFRKTIIDNAEIADKLQNETKFEEKNKAFDAFVDNRIYHFKTNTRRVKVVPEKSQTIFLYDTPGLLLPYEKYTIQVDKPYLAHSIMTPPTDFLKYSKIYDLGSCILNKSNLNLIQYYSFLYKGKQRSIKDTEVPDLFIHNDYMYYENHSEIFETYLKKCTPSLKNFIEIGLDGEFVTPFYNYYQAIKELETVHISELQSSDYLIIEAFLKIAVKRYIASSKLFPMTTKPSYKFIEQAVTSRLTNLYKELMPKDIQSVFFSNSELFKIGEIDNYKFYKDNSIKEVSTLDITDEEIQGMLDEIKAKASEEVEEKIAKVYKTEEERIEDKKSVLLKDINGIPGLEHIYQRLIGNKRKITLDKLKIMVDTIIGNGMKPTPKMPELSTEIIQYITEIKILEGEVAYVIETKKKYAWDGRRWIDVENNPTCFIKKKLYKGNCETLEKEKEYGERIVQLVKDIEQERKRQTEMKRVNSEINAQSGWSKVFKVLAKSAAYFSPEPSPRWIPL